MKSLRTKTIKRKKTARTLPYAASNKSRKRAKKAAGMPAAPTTIEGAELLLESLKREDGRRRSEYASRVVSERDAANRVTLRLTGHQLTVGDRILAAVSGYGEHGGAYAAEFAAYLGSLHVANELDVLHDALEHYRCNQNRKRDAERRKRGEPEEFTDVTGLGPIVLTLKSLATRVRASASLVQEVHAANKAEVTP
jgi:hypothetical protein